MRLFCLVAFLFLARKGLGVAEGGGGQVGTSEGIEGVKDKVVVDEVEEGEDVEGSEEDVEKDFSNDSSSIEEKAVTEETVGLNISSSASEETSKSPSSHPSSSGESELEGLDDKSVVDGSEDPPTTTDSDGPCSVCYCSTLDDMGNSTKMNNKMFSDLVETSNEMILIDCSHLNLSTWLPMEGSSMAVDFSYNLLTTLPTFSHEGGMVSLDLSYNQLTLLPPLHFAQLAASLLNLNLAGNKLAVKGLSDASLQMDPEQHLTQPWMLETLSLADNRLHSLPADIFGQLGRLQSLDLSSNPLSEMDAATIQAIGGIASLLSLSLAHCRLASLSHGLLDGLTQLEKLDLSENPFTIVDPRLRSAPSITSLVLDRSYKTLLPNQYQS